MHKNRPIPVVSIDGGAKTSKSTVCNAVAEVLQQRMRVKTADAGAFYRRVTAAVFDVLDVDGSENIRDESLDEAIDQVLAEGTAFDDAYPWGDLERPGVGRWVSVVGKRPTVQQEAMTWFGVVVDQAAETADVLVINARNPRLHLAQWLDNGRLNLLLELFTECDPAVAARRKLLSHGISEPTRQELEDEAQAITDRRNLDLTRPTDPFIEPLNLLPFKFGDDPKATVEKMWAADPAEAPLPIRFDTTDMSKEDMIQAAHALALAAFDFSQKPKK